MEFKENDETTKRTQLEFNYLSLYENFEQAIFFFKNYFLRFGYLKYPIEKINIPQIIIKENLNKWITTIKDKPKQIFNFMSEYLILGVYNKNDNVVLLKNEGAITNGEQVRS